MSSVVEVLVESFERAGGRSPDTGHQDRQHQDGMKSVTFPLYGTRLDSCPPLKFDFSLSW